MSNKIRPALFINLQEGLQSLSYDDDVQSLSHAIVYGRRVGLKNMEGFSWNVACIFTVCYLKPSRKILNYYGNFVRLVPGWGWNANMEILGTWQAGSLHS